MENRTWLIILLTASFFLSSGLQAASMTEDSYMTLTARTDRGDVVTATSDGNVLTGLVFCADGVEVVVDVSSLADLRGPYLQDMKIFADTDEGGVIVRKIFIPYYEYGALRNVGLVLTIDDGEVTSAMVVNGRDMDAVIKRLNKPQPPKAGR